MKNKFIPVLLFSLLLSSNVVFAEANKVRYISKAQNVLQKIANTVSISCLTDPQEKPVYSGQLTSIAVPAQVEPNQLFDITVKIKNTGNMPWFSNASGCPNQTNPVYLGTTRTQDRASQIHAPTVFGDTKWFQANRVKMKTPRVNPEEVAEFTFTGHAPATAGIYREYFSPVVENSVWIKGDAEFSFDLQVGQPEINQATYDITKDMPVSANLVDPKFEGEKSIKVDLSEQKMYISLGDQVVREFRVSTGKAKTPTPTGNYQIQFKQEVRVAGSSPHYIMPKFMQFRKGGYGIHALPSLANDRGVFWREALNHIGSPRSHGCIRLLPEDAEFTFNFADVGTPVNVVW